MSNHSNLLKKIEIDLSKEGDIVDITFFFHDSAQPNEPFSISEFTLASPTRKRLEAISLGIAQALSANE